MTGYREITMQHAAKQYRCTCCGGIIEKGEPYVRENCIDGRYIVRKEHKRCFEFMEGE